MVKILPAFLELYEFPYLPFGLKETEHLLIVHDINMYIVF
jgi:hypothetical protein